jgi:hypothetical protein
VEFAKSNGAKLISAFPIPEENRNRFPVNEAEFSGRLSTYLKFGFKPTLDDKQINKITGYIDEHCVQGQV